MMDGLASGFVQAPQGAQALQALAAQGVSGAQAQGILAAAIPAAAQAMRGASRGEKKNLPSIGDSNYVMNFTAAAVTGLIRGEGFMGSAVDGLQGVVGGYVAQVIAARFGLPKRTAGVIGAVITPLAIDWLWEKLEAGMNQMAEAGAVGALPGAAGAVALPAAAAVAALPAGHPGMLAAAAHYTNPAAQGYGYVQHQLAQGQSPYVQQQPAGYRYVPGQGYARGQETPQQGHPQAQQQYQQQHPQAQQHYQQAQYQQHYQQQQQYPQQQYPQQQYPQQQYQQQHPQAQQYYQQQHYQQHPGYAQPGHPYGRR